MVKQSIDPDWFTRLSTASLQEELKWLEPLSEFVECVVSFGCWTSEPFALMWVLDASEIKVVEKKQDRVDDRKDELRYLMKTVPLAFEGRSVGFAVADMTKKVTQLEDDYFDLAYCDRVLRQIVDAGLQEVQCAINEMARVVKPGGRVIAVEPITNRQRSLVSRDSISAMFEGAGLKRGECPPGAPKSAYCCGKPIA